MYSFIQNNKGKVLFKAIIIGLAMILVMVFIGQTKIDVAIKQKKEKKIEIKKWQGFVENLENIGYRPDHREIDELRNSQGVWQPSRKELIEIYKYVYGDALVPWQKFDGTDMSPLVDVVDENGNIVLKPNGNPLKKRINLIPHWQQEYNNAAELGELQGDVVKALRDKMRKNEVNADIVDIKNKNISKNGFDFGKIVKGMIEYLVQAVYAGVEFSDTFTVGSDTALASHSPDTGTGWTTLITVGSCTHYIVAAADMLDGTTSIVSGGCGNAEGQLTETDDTMSTANYDVSVYQQNGDTVDDTNMLACRIQDANNMYAVVWNEADSDLFIRNGGSWSTIDTTQNVGIADGSTVTLKCQGTTISVEDDGNVILTAEDSTHTGAGKAGVGVGAVAVSGEDVSGQRLDSFSVDVTVGASNNAPTVVNVTDLPDSIGVGAELRFTVDWSDADSGEMVKAVICKGSGITTSTAACKDGEWARSPVWTNRNPENQVTYTTLAGDKDSIHNYWAFICDDSGDSTTGCSDGTLGTFQVINQRPDAPITLLVEGMEVGNASNITDTSPDFSAIYKDSNDEGDVAVRYCIEVDTLSTFLGTDMWISDSASCYTGSAFSPNAKHNKRSKDFGYNGSTLAMDGTVYYWRMWLWDGEERSVTSTTGWFNMANTSSGGGGVRLQGGRFIGNVRLQ